MSDYKNFAMKLSVWFYLGQIVRYLVGSNRMAQGVCLYVINEKYRSILCDINKELRN